MSGPESLANKRSNNEDLRSFNGAELSPIAENKDCERLKSAEHIELSRAAAKPPTACLGSNQAVVLANGSRHQHKESTRYSGLWPSHCTHCMHNIIATSMLSRESIPPTPIQSDRVP